MNKKQILIRSLIIILIVFVALLVLLQKRSIQIKTAGKIIPSSDFRLIQDFPNSLILEENHYLHSENNKRSSFNFDRGDVVDFTIKKNKNFNSYIEKNTKLGSINSEKLSQEILQIEAELNKTRAQLIADSTGRKNSVIEKAKNDIKLRETQLKEQKLIVERMGELKKSNLVSEQKYEFAKNDLDIQELQVLVAQSNLETVLTGAKPEAVKVYHYQIKSLEKELKLLKNRKKKYEILSPISGDIEFHQHSDTLLTIENRNELAVIFPVTIDKISKININQEVIISLKNLNLQSNGSITKIDNKIHVINNNQFFIVTAKIEKNIFPSGSIVNCNIQCEKEQIIKNFITKFKQIEIN